MNSALTIAAACFILAAVIAVYSRYARWAPLRDAITTTRLPARLRRVTEHGAVIEAVVDSDLPYAEDWQSHLPALGIAIDRAQPAFEPIDTRSFRLLFLPKGRRPELTALAPWETTPPATLPDLRALPVARDAYGRPWTMPVHGAHQLVIGATGSGKGSVIWSVMNELAPGIRDGIVHAWGIDPKGGVELGLGRELFTRLVRNGSQPWENDLARLLRDARELMDARLERMYSARSRLHQPTTDEPLVVLIVDEFLTLTLGITDRRLANQIETDLVMLLSKGRAAGVAVMACAQLAQKDALDAKIRDLFPVRIGLRMTDQIQVDMAMGREARAAGAACHEIPPTHPGVAWVFTENRGVRMVRFPWTSDDNILSIADEYQHRRIEWWTAPTVNLEQLPTDQTEPLHTNEQPVVASTDDTPTVVESKADRVRHAITINPNGSTREIAAEVGVTERYVRMVRAATEER